MSVASLRPRTELDPAETWALDHLFPSREAFDTAFDEAEQRVAELDRFRGRLGDDAETFHAALVALSDFSALFSRIKLYASLPSYVDQFDDEARRLMGRFMGNATEWVARMSFLEPELLALPPERLASFRGALPELARFAHYLDRLERRRPFVRSSQVEDVLARAGAPLSHLSGARERLANGDTRFTEVLVEGGEIIVAPSTIRGLERSGERDIRRQAFVSYADGHLAVQETFAELYQGVVRQQAFEAQVRGHASGEAAALFERHVTPEILDATLEAFTRRLPVWHRYWEARRRLLGVERLEPWDVAAPLQVDPPRIDIATAYEWIEASAAPLGKPYVERLRAALREERWVDLRPSVGKSEGAFCAAAPGAHPYILTSYVDDLQSASMLAHELGHALHAELVHAHQDPLDDFEALGMTVAETASNAQQGLLRAFVLDGPATRDDRLEFAVLEEALWNYHRYLFVMPTLVRFERVVHAGIAEGASFTGAELTGIMRDLFQEGYGDAVTADERVGITWAQFGHLYAPYYTFQYAVGLAAATVLVEAIRSGEAGAVERYLAFLTAGPTVAPVELFASLGLDVTTPAPVERAFDVLEGYVARLESIVR
jgi:oligoendopeptidase F